MDIAIAIVIVYSLLFVFCSVPVIIGNDFNFICNCLAGIFPDLYCI